MMELEIELKKVSDSLKKWLHYCGEIDVVFVQDKKVNKILNPECTHTQRLKSIVSFTSLTKAKKDGASSIGIKSYSWNDFLHMGSEYPSDLVPPQPFNICTIMYTSGTSGEPKGVIHKRN